MKPGESASISIPDIYIKLPELKPNKKGTLVKNQIYTPVATVAVIYVRRNTGSIEKNC